MIITPCRFLIVCLLLCLHFSPSQSLCSVPTENVQKPGSDVYIAQYPGFYRSTPGSIFRFLKTGLWSYIKVSATRIRCLPGQNITRILQKPDHNQDTSVHVNALYESGERHCFLAYDYKLTTLQCYYFLRCNQMKYII